MSFDFFLIEEIVVFTLALTVELSRISDSRIIMTVEKLQKQQTNEVNLNRGDNTNLLLQAMVLGTLLCDY